VLRLVDISRRFGTQQVLSGLNLEIAFSGVTFVLGKSGAGKSVLGQTAVGLLRPDSGQVWVGEQRIDRLPERQLREVRSQLAYVAQGPAMLDWLTLKDNVALAPRRARRLTSAVAQEQAAKALDSLDLGQFGPRMPREVGPGIHKRVAVARALACGPKAILYDEPTTGLDPRAARQVDQVILRATQQGSAAIVVSHDLESVRSIAQRVLVLHRGQIGFDGTVDELFKSRTDAVLELLGS
jgi:phospholipid/cholesterol/gamma-HCH transport system ATP-binding protein